MNCMAFVFLSRYSLSYLINGWLYDLRGFFLQWDWCKRLYARHRLRNIDCTDVRSFADVEFDLVKLGKPVVRVLVKHLYYSNPMSRLTALRALAKIDEGLAKVHTSRFLTDKNPKIVEEATRLSARWRPEVHN